FFFHGRLNLLVTNIHLELFSVFIRKVHITGNSLRKTTTTNTKHLGTFNATVIYNSDVGCTTTNVADDSGKIAGTIITKHTAAHSKRVSGNGKEFQRKLIGHTLERTNVNHRGKRSINLHCNVTTLEPNWVTYLVPVNV